MELKKMDMGGLLEYLMGLKLLEVLEGEMVFEGEMVLEREMVLEVEMVLEGDVVLEWEEVE